MVGWLIGLYIQCTIVRTHLTHAKCTPYTRPIHICKRGLPCVRACVCVHSIHNYTHVYPSFRYIDKHMHTDCHTVRSLTSNLSHHHFSQFRMMAIALVTCHQQDNIWRNIHGCVINWLRWIHTIGDVNFYRKSIGYSLVKLLDPICIGTTTYIRMHKWHSSHSRSSLITFILQFANELMRNWGRSWCVYLSVHIWL